jgi:hypothetical protein
MRGRLMEAQPREEYLRCLGLMVLMADELNDERPGCSRLAS